MVRFFFALICVLLLQLSKAKCQETNWILFFTNIHNDQYYFNCKTIIRGKTSFVVWMRYLPSLETQARDANRERTSVESKFDSSDESKIKDIIDFKNRRVKTVIRYFYLKGNPVNIWTYSKENGWEDIVPETAGDFELTAVKKYLHIKN